MMNVMLVAGCTPQRIEPFQFESPATRDALESVPPPSQKVVVAVYAFPDMTGQHRETTSGQAHYSRAVTQGGSAMLIDALKRTGRGQWFTVVERNRLDHVTNERRIIRDQRQAHADAQGNRLPPPRPLLYAGVIIEGAIIGYDTNHLTGGAGARFLGVGAHTQYREDIVTINLRAVSSQTSQIWENIIVSQRIYSVQLQGDVFRFVRADRILESEAGVTRNEPRTLALQKAIERAVYMMLMQGAERRIWSFADEAEGRKALTEYYRTLSPGPPR